MPTHCKVSHCVDEVLHCVHPLLTFVHSLFGDEQEVAFWTVALYYMLREKNRLQDPRYKVTHSLQAHFVECRVMFNRCTSMLIVATQAVTSSVQTRRPRSALAQKVSPPPPSQARAWRICLDQSTLTLASIVMVRTATVLSYNLL